jgi:hypothetical protein
MGNEEDGSGRQFGPGYWPRSDCLWMQYVIENQAGEIRRLQPVLFSW